MKLLAVFAFTLLCGSVLALNCYTCSGGEQDGVQPCLDAPENLTITDCNKKYCVIIRQEYKNQERVASIYRGCEDNPLHIHDIIEDESYRFYFSACQQPLCNGDSGKFESSSLLI